MYIVSPGCLDYLAVLGGGERELRLLAHRALGDMIWGPSDEKVSGAPLPAFAPTGYEMIFDFRWCTR